MRSYFFIVIFLMVNVFYSPLSFSENMSRNICEYVAADDKKRLRSFLKSKRIKLRSIFSDLQCNKMNILIFADSSKSENVGGMLIKKLPKKIVAINIDELTKHSDHLASLAKKRVE